MGYKLLGWVVWKGARWYVGRKLGAALPGRRALVAGLVVAGAAGAVAVGAAQGRRAAG